jgi:putative peptide zinc metalloprotease protein
MNEFAVDFEQRKALIAQHPCFFSLSATEVETLARLAFEKSFSPQEIIIRQHEVVDAIYLVSSGEIEASALEANHETIPQSLLRHGDAIGISYTGFFSEDGLRTRTLIALTPVTLIGWTIDKFHLFVESHPILKQAMLRMSKMMLKMNFIKQVEPFEKLPPEQISWLAQNIDEIAVEEGTVLFHQGELGENCYLIVSGEVLISSADSSEDEREVARLTSPMLFGESILLNDTTRTSTARMTQGGKLLLLRKEQLDRLMHYPTTSEAMMVLMVQRCLPKRKEGILSYQRQMEDGLQITILKDPKRGHYFQLSQEGWLIWEQIDGRKNLEDLSIELFKALNLFAPGAVADTLFKLSDAGFIDFIDMSGPPIEREQETRFSSIKFVSDKVDGPLTSSYESFVHHFFTPLGQSTIALTALLGGLAFLFDAKSSLALLAFSSHLILLLLGVFVAHLLTVFFHELAHGYTTKFFSHSVNRAGVVFNWFGLGLVAFVDTSDMWLSDRRSRIIVSLAGPYWDLFFAGLCSLIAWLFAEGSSGLFFWLLALTLYYGAYKNLLPLLDNDGYAVLKEAEASSLWQVGLASILLFAVALASAFILQAALPDQLSPYGWLLPTYLAVNFLFRLWRAIRRRRHG